MLNTELLTTRLRRDPPEFVALTWKAVDQITGKQPRRGPTPILPAMRGRYRLLTRLDVPVGPVFIFWNEVYVYARSDLSRLGDYSM